MKTVTDKQTGEVLEFTDAEFDKIQYDLITRWNNAKTALEAAKETELKLRKEVVDFSFDQSNNKGTETIELENGWKAKAVKKLNFGWIKDGDKVNKHKIDDALDAIERSDPAGQLIAERLVKWTPELSQTEYKKLPLKMKEIIDAVIVTSEGTPTLELIPPKAPK